MTQVAAEVADGMMMHPFSTEAYMREVTLPAIEKGLAAAGRSREDFVLDYAPMVATGADEEAVAKARESVRERIAFYARTVAYRPVLDLHGWGWLQDELIARREQGEAADLGRGGAGRSGECHRRGGRAGCGGDPDAAAAWRVG